MENRTAALSSVGACGVGFLAGWLIFRSDGTDGIDGSVPSPGPQGLQHVVQESRITSEPPSLERPDNRVPALTSAPVPEPAQSPEPAPEAKPQTLAVGDPRLLPEGTLAEMIGKRGAVESYLRALMFPIIVQRVKDGHFEHLPAPPPWTESEFDKQRSELSTITTADGGGVNRVVLPRSEYPGLYELKDEVDRLGDQIELANPGNGQEDMKAPK